MARQWTAPPKDFHKRLRAARGYLGMHLKPFAELYGAHRNTISDWESGDSFPNTTSGIIGLIERYVELTGMPRWWFEVADINQAPSEDAGPKKVAQARQKRGASARGDKPVRRKKG